MNELPRDFYDLLIKDARSQGITRYVIGAVIKRNYSVLLLQRPKADFMGGIYELPGGEAEKDETLQGTVIREVKEETGLKVNKITRYLGHFDYPSKSGNTTRQFNFEVSVEDELEVILHEHDNYAWAEQQKIQNYNMTESVRKVLSAFWQQ